MQQEILKVVEAEAVDAGASPAPLFTFGIYPSAVNAEYARIYGDIGGDNGPAAARTAGMQLLTEQERMLPRERYGDVYVAEVRVEGVLLETPAGMPLWLVILITALGAAVVLLTGASYCKPVCLHAQCRLHLRSSQLITYCCAEWPAHTCRQCATQSPIQRQQSPPCRPCSLPAVSVGTLCAQAPCSPDKGKQPECGCYGKGPAPADDAARGLNGGRGAPARGAGAHPKARCCCRCSVSPPARQQKSTRAQHSCFCRLSPRCCVVPAHRCP